MRFLVTCTIEHSNDLFRICIHELAKEPLTWLIKENCAQNVVPRHGEKFNSFGLLRCPYWSIVRKWLLYWEIYRPFIEMHLFWELWRLFFVHGFEEDRPKHGEKWSWVKNEVLSVVCGAMFGDERVNNSVHLLSRALVTFSLGQISALVAVIL